MLANELGVNETEFKTVNRKIKIKTRAKGKILLGVTWIMYNCAIRYSSTLIGSGILYSLISISVVQIVPNRMVEYAKALYLIQAANLGLT